MKIGTNFGDRNNLGISESNIQPRPKDFFSLYVSRPQGFGASSLYTYMVFYQLYVVSINVRKNRPRPQGLHLKLKNEDGETKSFPVLISNKRWGKVGKKNAFTSDSQLKIFHVIVYKNSTSKSDTFVMSLPKHQKNLFKVSTVTLRWFLPTGSVFKNSKQLLRNNRK